MIHYSTETRGLESQVGKSLKLQARAALLPLFPLLILTKIDLQLKELLKSLMHH